MAAGKSTVGRLVAEAAGMPFSDLDELIEAAAAASVATIFEREGESGFRRRESTLLATALQAPGVVALGGGTAADDANWALIKRQSLPVWIDTPFELIWQRLDGVPGRPLVQGRDRRQLQDLFESRLARYREALHRVDGARGPEEIASEVLRLWIG